VPEIELSLRVAEVSDVQVDTCQAHGGARIAAGSIVATVGQTFELLFRLAGAGDSKVLVEIYHQGAEADVVPCVVDGRFAVTPRRVAQGVSSRKTSADTDRNWLSDLPEGGARRLFEHLAKHGSVTEDEASAMLGGPRELRRFANRFEEFAAKLPFDVRIDVIAGVKRYVRQGPET
jgi:hypothetical protein